MADYRDPDRRDADRKEADRHATDPIIVEGPSQERRASASVAGERTATDWSRGRPAERVVYPADGDRAGTGRDERSVTDLLRELSNEGSTLVRKEIELARTEMGEKLHTYKRSLVGIAIGGALLLIALLLLVEAVSTGLIMLFENWVGLETAIWLAPILLAVVIGLIGLARINSATGAMKREGVAPHATIDTLKEDKRWVERKVKS